MADFQYKRIAGLEQECERLKQQVQGYEEPMRAIACSLGAGGYNAAELSAEELVSKVQWGIENFTATQSSLIDKLRTELEACRKDAERYRWMCEKFGITKLPCAIERILAGDVYVADGKNGIDAAIDAAMQEGGV